MKRKVGLSENQPKKHKKGIFSNLAQQSWLIFEIWTNFYVINHRAKARKRVFSESNFSFKGGVVKSGSYYLDPTRYFYLWSLYGYEWLRFVRVWVGLGSHVSNINVFRMNRVTQFVSFTSIMSISMICLAVMLLLLAQGTEHPVAVQVTLHPHSSLLLSWEL